MSFDKDTIVEMMTLIDIHQDDVKEAEYVKMCNAIRYLYQGFKDKPIPTSRASPPPSTQSVRFTELQLAQFRVEGINTAIRQSEVRTPDILNIHRQKVIEELTQESFRGPRGGIKILRRVDINRKVPLLISSGLIINEDHFEELSMVKAREDAASYIRRLRVLLNESVTQLENLRSEQNN
jgi:hypothetical protein